jgi:pullulanase/glycogen debranching enzyme
MFWQEGFQDRSLLEHYRHLTALRHAHPALRSGYFAPLPLQLDAADASREQVGAYLRHQDGDRLLVALNNTHQPVTLTIPLADIASALGDTADHLIGTLAYATTPPSTFTVRDGALHLALSPLSAAVLTLM